MNNTINVSRELLERVLNAGWGSETVNALDDLRDFLESATSPAGVDDDDEYMPDGIVQGIMQSQEVDAVALAAKRLKDAGVDGLPEFLTPELEELGREAVERATQDGCNSSRSLEYAYGEAVRKGVVDDAQAIIDGLRGENQRLQQELRLHQSQIESSGRIADRAQRVAVQLRTERDQLAGLLREVHDTYRAAIHWEDLRGTMKRIDAALSAGKEGSDG